MTAHHISVAVSCLVLGLAFILSAVVVAAKLQERL
jgi:hypothetical protein